LSAQVLDLCKLFHFKGTELDSRLKEDARVIEEIVAENRKHAFSAWIHEKQAVYVTHKGISFAGDEISVADVETVRWGIYARTVNGVETEHSCTLVVSGGGRCVTVQLDKRGLTAPIREAAKKIPFLGICLGMQLLFEEGYEFEEREGLGLIPGRIDRIPDTGLRIPHIGWNSLEFKAASPLLAGLNGGDSCYFVHSFMAFTDEQYVAASVDYGVKIPALVQNGSVYGTQFHPEKSSRVGLKMLENFGRL
jgi:glutamine amidotransferase